MFHNTQYQHSNHHQYHYQQQKGGAAAGAVVSHLVSGVLNASEMAGLLDASQKPLRACGGAIYGPAVYNPGI